MTTPPAQHLSDFYPAGNAEAASATPATIAEISSGLLARQAWTSPKYLYDALGSKLFEAICALPEYYPTRTEAAIFARHQRLKDLALKTQADLKASAAKSEAEYVKNKDADSLSKLGFALVHDGQTDKGLDLMNQAVKLGTAKYPEEAQLHLGIAYGVAGKKANAQSALKAVKGTDGAADLARYWSLMLK